MFSSPVPRLPAQNVISDTLSLPRMLMVDVVCEKEAGWYTLVQIIMPIPPMSVWTPLGLSPAVEQMFPPCLPEDTVCMSSALGGR